MRYLSVCSGIEAASVAWKPLGWEAAAFAEIEPFPCAVLEHRFPDVPNHGDFTQIEIEPGSADLLVGGTPCQSFSVAGLRKGLADDRGCLALEYLRLADNARPRWVVWENVPGVLSSGGGRDFGAFVGGLAELGYGWAYRVLDAQYFGVPQRRRRVFVVGCLGDWRRAAAVLFERESMSGHPPPRREAGRGAASSVAPGARGGSEDRGLDAFQLSRGGLACRGLTGRESDFSPAIDRHGTDPIRNQGGLLIAHTLRADGFDASEDGTGRGTPLVPVNQPYNIIGMAQDGRNHAVLTDVSGCLQHKGLAASGNEAGTLIATASAWQSGGNGASLGFDPESETVQALVTEQTPAIAFQERRCAARSAVRRLTPLECERLMGFPDGWTLVPYRGKPAADAPRYKALGNSIATPVLRWIGSRIQMVDSL